VITKQLFLLWYSTGVTDVMLSATS